MVSSLETIISGIDKARFADALIDGITGTADVAHDGDPTLRITAVVDRETAEPQPGKLAGLVRHLRPQIMSRQDAACSEFRFITKRDNERPRHAAA